MNQPVTTVLVNYHNIDGYHYFNSEDVLGLHVGSRDLKAAYNDVPRVIETLMMANYGIECEAIPTMTFNEFLMSTGAREDSRRCFELKMAA